MNFIVVILANVEGSTKFYQNGDNSFYALIEIENNNKNKTGFILCSAQIPFQENNFVNLTCHLNITSEEKSAHAMKEFVSGLIV